MTREAAIAGVVMYVCASACAPAQEAPVGKTATETQAAQGATPAASNEAARLNKMAERFAPTEIVADVSRLPPADRQVPAKLVRASKIVDETPALGPQRAVSLAQPDVEQAREAREASAKARDAKIRAEKRKAERRRQIAEQRLQQRMREE